MGTEVTQVRSHPFQALLLFEKEREFKFCIDFFV